MATLSTTLTVIIPTYNRSDILKKCIDALTRQSFPEDQYEIIVVDDGSGDDTRTVVDFANKHCAAAIRYLWQPNTGANAARNQAIRHASGQLLLFVNDDTIATSTMLSAHVKTHQNHIDENTAVLGRVTLSPEVPCSMFSKDHLDAGYALWQGKEELDWRAFYTCNISVKKTYLEKFGVFDESLRYFEDLELSERLSCHGLKVIYNPLALGYHFHWLQEKEYMAIAKREGTALAKWYRKSPHLKKELAAIGFYPYMAAGKRFQYAIADLIINRFTAFLLLSIARKLSRVNESLSLALYKQLFQAIKREAIRHELDRKA